MAKRAWGVSVEGLELLQSRIERYGIDCEYAPGYMSVVVKRRRAKALERRGTRRSVATIHAHHDRLRRRRHGDGPIR